MVADFLLGKPWPAHVEPVVHHIPRTIGSGIQVLGEDSEGDASFNFHQSRAEATLAGFLKAWVRTLIHGGIARTAKMRLPNNSCRSCRCNVRRRSPQHS